MVVVASTAAGWGAAPPHHAGVSAGHLHPPTTAARRSNSCRRSLTTGRGDNLRYFIKIIYGNLAANFLLPHTLQVVFLSSEVSLVGVAYVAYSHSAAGCSVMRISSGKVYSRENLSEG